METIFIEGALPSGYRCEFDSYIFNLPQNLTIQSSDGWHTYYALRREKKIARARINFHIKDGVALSPFKNPFGSYEISDTMLPRELYEFIKWVESALKSRGVKRIEMKSYPQLYHSERSSLITTFLLNQGYHIKEAELSACIPVNTNTLFSMMTSWEKRKSGMVKRSALRFSQIPVSKLKEVYECMNAWNEERKQALSLTFGQLKSISDIFPERFCLFGVYDVNALAAASISILINKNILYNFYSAHAKQYDSLSPIFGLMEGIYSYCQTERITLIDLGTSALNGRPHFGLLDFKLYLGASPTPKFTFEKTLQ